MPFWWRRRRKPWFGRWTTYKRKRRYKPRRKRRRIYRRRRTYRTNKRRRRSRRKVRRKQQKIILKQWQPESIKKCKIKGLGVLVLGAEGTQYRCFTDYKNEWTSPKLPGGGGFGCELYTLEYLYSEYKAKNNIWTSSNKYRDLCRYTGCTITLFRHPQTDFVFAYDIQPPFTINKYTYMFLHPQMMLLRKNKKIILSTATNPKGKLYKKIKIKPPKQLSTKWFFQQEFTKYGLVALAASACNFRYPWLGCCNENLIITLYYLQADFYKDSGWAQASITYNPMTAITQMATNNIYYYDINKKDLKYTMNPDDVKSYDGALNYDKGWFCSKVLKAWKVTSATGKELGLQPCGIIRYNPAIDTGKGSKLWVVNTLTHDWRIPTDEDLIMEGYPLWLMLHGYTSFLYQVKGQKQPFSSGMIVVKSDAISRVKGIDTRGFYPILDQNFINGRNAKDTPPWLFQGKYWYPSIYAQRESISQIVNCGPYIPKYNEEKYSTWQLNYRYNFYFKWGGSYPPGQDAEDPEKKKPYPVPDKFQETVSIADPVSQKYETIFKTWDYRRGSLTKTAIKRMQQNLQTDDSLSTDSTGCSSAKKKRLLPTLQNPKKENQEIQNCLRSLCEENTWQEPKEDTNIYQLLQQQHQQQQQLKHNLLTLIANLKSQQRTILHQTGYLA
nr:MAG: ORF1 [Torque teno midi virus]